MAHDFCIFSLSLFSFQGFFRRTINERESNRYQCSKGGRCDVTVHTRNNCKSCRYMKCLAVGMSKTGTSSPVEEHSLESDKRQRITYMQPDF